MIHLNFGTFRQNRWISHKKKSHVDVRLILMHQQGAASSTKMTSSNSAKLSRHFWEYLRETVWGLKQQSHFELNLLSWTQKCFATFSSFLSLLLPCLLHNGVSFFFCWNIYTFISTYAKLSKWKLFRLRSIWRVWWWIPWNVWRIRYASIWNVRWLRNGNVPPRAPRNAHWKVNRLLEGSKWHRDLSAQWWFRFLHSFFIVHHK